MAVVEMGMTTLDPIQRLDGHATKHGHTFDRETA